MAHYQHQLTGDADDFVAYLDRAIPEGSVTTKFETGADHWIGDARMIVHTYERYSALGGNRVSLCISILSVGNAMALSAVSLGRQPGDVLQAEHLRRGAFLKRAVSAIEAYVPAS